MAWTEVSNRVGSTDWNVCICWAGAITVALICQITCWGTQSFDGLHTMKINCWSEINIGSEQVQNKYYTPTACTSHNSILKHRWSSECHIQN